MLIIIFIILGIIILILGYTTFNLLNKNEKLEDIVLSQEEFVTHLQGIIKFSSNKLKEIDERGIFESDDEIGWFFSQIKYIDTLLSQFKPISNNDKNPQEEKEKI